MQNLSEYTTSRRKFLKISAATGTGLVLGISLSGCSDDEITPPPTAAGAEQLNAWLNITPDNQVIFFLDKAEMGQGVYTGLVMILAEELDFDPEVIDIRMAPVHEAYNNAAFGMQGTGGSTSVMAGWGPLREAGAAAREMLKTAAANRWQVGIADLLAENGLITNKKNGETLTYGELAEDAAQLTVPADVTLKKKSDFKLIGKNQNRLDALGKSTGTTEFGIDVDVPGILTAVVLRCPVFGGKVKSFDDSQARENPDVVDIFNISSGVAVVARTYWAARKASELIDVTWDEGDLADLSSASIRTTLKGLMEEEGISARDDGDVVAATEQASSTISADYYVPYLAHATMEPMNATASVTDKECIIWAPTQFQTNVPSIASAITGLEPEQVTLHTTFMGGGFGRRAMPDFIIEAVECSNHLKRPVKVVWSREDDMRHDFYRPMAYHRVTASFDQNNQLTGWQQRIAAPSLFGQMVELMGGAMAPAWIPDGIKNFGIDSAQYLMSKFIADATSTEGISDMVYDVANVSVDCHNWDPGIPLGFWRSVGHSQNAFVMESFLDEVAHQVGQDPYEYRRGLLKNDARRLAVLDKAAELAGWGQAPEGRYQGIAVHKSFGSYVAQVAEISIEDDTLQVHKITCVVDCGQVITPNIVVDQMEGGIVYGLTAALYGQIDIEDGRVVQGNFDDYPMMRMDVMPIVDVHIMDSDEAPAGVGEPGTPPIAPAICNAIFAATGQRIRELPLTDLAP